MVSKVLSISGFDPCAGAGMLADSRIFEFLKASFIGVCTCLTYQNHDSISGIKWFTKEEILSQIQSLLQKYKISHVKISLVPNLHVLETIIKFFQDHSPQSVLIWDPVYQSSTGFFFYSSVEYESLKKMLPFIDIVTPNFFEFKTWFPDLKLEDLKKSLKTKWIIKSYIKDSTTIGDLLVFNGQYKIKKNKFLEESKKHGTGCTLSSALAVFLAQGHSLEDAYEKSSQYLQNFLRSSDNTLGYYFNLK